MDTLRGKFVHSTDTDDDVLLRNDRFHDDTSVSAKNNNLNKVFGMLSEPDHLLGEKIYQGITNAPWC